MKEELIFYLVKKDEWKSKLQKGSFKPEIVDEKGYLPCSTGDQIEKTANDKFAGETEVLLLVIDPTRVTERVTYEKNESTDEQMPRIHGALNTDAVIDKIDIAPNNDGKFEIKVDSN